MLCWALLCFLLLPGSAHLPAPVNVSVISRNFHHVLRWDPGPGTPPRAQYRILKRLYGSKQGEQLNSTKTSLKLELSSLYVYQLTVRAYYNHTLSDESKTCSFAPYKDTTIGPPNVSLAGCGNCIQINISLPEADRSSGVDDIQKFYNPQFKAVCMRGGKEMVSYVTKDSSFTLRNLNVGEEYCVQVHTQIVTNKWTLPSPVKCVFTSIVEERKVPVVLTETAVLLIFSAGFIITLVFCLHYTGFLCKLKDRPRLLMAVGQGYTLTPEETIPNVVSIDSKQNKPAVQPPAVGNEEEQEEEEEEDEQFNAYMGRPAQCATGESLCLGSGDTSMHSEPAAAADCESWTERVSAEAELSDAECDDGVSPGDLQEDLVKAEGTKEKKEEMKEERNCCGNVNLFSVTLSALAAEEQGEQNEEEPLSTFWKLSDPELLQTLPQCSLGNKTQSEDQIGLMRDAHEDFTEAGYEGRRANISRCIPMQSKADQEGEEDDDALFEYMVHM